MFVGREKRAGRPSAQLVGGVDALCDDMAALRKAGADIIVVSSGSIALGRTVMQGTGLGPSRGRLKLEESQAAAAIGQIALAKAWVQASTL